MSAPRRVLRCPFCRRRISPKDEECPHCGEELFEDDDDDEYDDDDRRPSRHGGDASAEQGLQWLVPIGRSGWSIAAGYLGLLSFVPFVGLVFGGLAVVTGILGLQASSRDRRLGGRGRAIFGIVAGGLCFIANVVLIILVAYASARKEKLGGG